MPNSTNLNKNSNLGLLIGFITFIPKDMDITFSSCLFGLCLDILFHLLCPKFLNHYLGRNDSDHIAVIYLRIVSVIITSSMRMFRVCIDNI